MPEEPHLRLDPPPERDQRPQHRHPLHPPRQALPVLTHAQEPDPEHQRHDRPDHGAEDEDAAARELGRLVDVLGDEVAEEGERRRPEARSEHAVGDERAVRHPRAAGDERRQRPYEADEPPDQDRLAAVALEVRLHLGEALLGDPHLRPVPQHEPAPQPLAEQEAHRVARPGAEPDDRQHQDDRVLALAGERAADDHRRLAGEDEADEGAGLGERQQADEQVREVAEVGRHVLEPALDVQAGGEPLEGDEAAERGGR